MLLSVKNDIFADNGVSRFRDNNSPNRDLLKLIYSLKLNAKLYGKAK